MSESEVLIEFGEDRLDDTQRAIRSAAFLQLLETGEPARIGTVSRTCGTPERLVRRVLEGMNERGSVQLEKGQVFGIAGLSVTPTKHSIVLPQGDRWTWCALDAIGIVGAVGSGSITSRTVGGDVTLSLEDGAFHPEGMAIFIADGYGTTSSIGQWCPMVDFFPDGASADGWAEQNEVSGRGMTITQLAPMAAARWRTIIGDG